MNSQVFRVGDRVVNGRGEGARVYSIGNADALGFAKVYAIWDKYLPEETPYWDFAKNLTHEELQYDPTQQGDLDEDI